MTRFDVELKGRLEEIQRLGLLRRLSSPRGIDFSSNDYLGLGSNADFHRRFLERLARERERVPVCTPASRLLRGNDPLHLHVERRLAAFKGMKQALLFPSGYQANIGLLTALIEPRDRVLSDELNHASIIDGLRLCRCRKVIFPHRDVQAVGQALATPHPQGRTFLVTESLFSMEGDIAPLDQYADLTRRLGAGLIVDDAHATGIYGGARGSGLCEHFKIEDQVLAVVSTLGKAFALWGAFVAASEVLIDYLINRCRAFIFSTAVSPLLLHGIETALDYLQEHPGLRTDLLNRSALLRQQLASRKVSPVAGKSPIVPVVVQDNERVLQVAGDLQSKGFDVRGVRPPTVPEGTARVRISVHADHREEDLCRLAEVLARSIGRRLGKVVQR